MTTLRRIFLLLCFILAGTAQAQDRLLSPAEFLGYELGDRFTPHHRVVDYVRHVGGHSLNVVLQPYGETYEGRLLQVAYITLPKHLDNLDQIRTNNLKLTGLEDGEVQGATPSIVWLSYNVHGNESVSTEAAMATLFDLANPQNAQTQAWLENTLVILDPCINPDGRDRYVHWYNRAVGRTLNADPNAREHREPWPGGRTNHYWFDLNRDWAWQTQQESQQRLALYRQWMPHVHADFHEQGVNSPYFFAPAAEPYHEDITPWQRQFQTMIGKNHARYFDANGWLYFTRQMFDLFYPAYGDTWPTYNGAIGMTYEQGGSGRAGLAIVTAEGDTLTLRDRIDHHHTTGLSTIETTANNHTRVVDEFKKYFEQARTSPPGSYKTYVVKGTNEPDKLDALANLLERQDIRFGYATRNHTASGFNYHTGKTEDMKVAAGDLIVSAYQPKSVLTKVLFEPQPHLADSLTYDITAWALPYAYGLETYALNSRIDPDTPSAPNTEPTLPTLEKPYAYLAPWKSLADVQFLAALLEQKVKLRFSEKPFEIEGKLYAPGTLILTRTGNEAMGERFDRTIRETARTFGQTLSAVPTGFVTQGSDFGSGDVPFLKKPRVAVLAGSPISSSAAGEIWHFFDQQIQYPVSMLDAEALGSIDLRTYDVLILPNGSYSRILTDSRLNDLKAWVRNGGRLIALEGAVSFLADKEGFQIKKKAATTEEKDAAGKQDEALRQYGNRNRDRVSSGVSGSIFRVRMDPSHPLGFGYTGPYFTLKRSSTAYDYLKGTSNWNVGVLQSDNHVSGFAGYKVKGRLKDTLVFGVQQMGRGDIIYLVDNPLFRAFWYNGKLLFSNAVFMVR